MTTANEIREKFLNFFAEKGHKIIPSASLIPQNDPSLLFTSAGMNPFKEYFLHPPAGLTRAVSCQKCLRTADIEKVSRTAGHHIFFEMLGNFSFGDYFKKEAIEWAWEFLTSVLDIPRQKLWVSVFENDEESYQIWKERVKIPAQRIKRFGQKENFWPSNALKNGSNGPCGPCSEIFYDWGEEFSCGKDCNLNCDCGRFIEVWNLVFTQSNRQDEKIENLENKNIDTGMGLERITAVVQGVRNDFQTELFKPIVTEVTSHQSPVTSPVTSHYIIADYIRAVVFAIADGVIPANEKRGYVIRKLIRKAAKLAGDLQMETPFLSNLVPAVAKIAQDTYPEVKQEEQRIKDIINNEEEKFAQTMERAKEILRTKKRIDEKVAFELYDTYGLPYENIEDLALQKGIKLDKQKFTQYVEKQRQRSRESSGFAQQIFIKGNSKLPGTVGVINKKEKARKQGLPLADVWGKEELNVARNHTTTHILQSVLREIFGKHIKQAGSIVFPSYFHFDFTHPKSLTDEELSRVEEMVNEKIIKNDSVKRELMPKKKAIESGAIGLFEEKYGEEVTIVSIGNYSKEFCGGVHIENTAEIGLFKIVKESSVGAGIRRIEAVSGRFAYQLIKRGEDDLKEKLAIALKEMKEIKKKNGKLKKELFSYYAEDLAKKAEGNVIVEQFFDFDLAELRELVDILGKKIEIGIVGLASVKDNKVYLIMNANKNLSKNIHCGQIINEIAQTMDGKGGGRADFAQASAKRAEKLPEALKVWKEKVKKSL